MVTSGSTRTSHLNASKRSRTKTHKRNISLETCPPKSRLEFLRPLRLQNPASLCRPRFSFFYLQLSKNRAACPALTLSEGDKETSRLSPRKGLLCRGRLRWAAAAITASCVALYRRVSFLCQARSAILLRKKSGHSQPGFRTSPTRGNAGPEFPKASASAGCSSSLTAAAGALSGFGFLFLLPLARDDSTV